MSRRAAAKVKPAPERPAPEPDIEPTELPSDTVRIDLEGALAGHWTRIKREQTGRQLLAMLEASEDFAPVLRVVGERTVEHSFGGDILDQPLSVIAAVIQSWQGFDRNGAIRPKPASG